jgi:hypothetical protein
MPHDAFELKRWLDTFEQPEKGKDHQRNPNENAPSETVLRLGCLGWLGRLLVELLIWRHVSLYCTHV